MSVRRVPSLSDSHVNSVFDELESIEKKPSHFYIQALVCVWDCTSEQTLGEMYDNVNEQIAELKMVPFNSSFTVKLSGVSQARLLYERCRKDPKLQMTDIEFRASEFRNKLFALRIEGCLTQYNIEFFGGIHHQALFNALTQKGIRTIIKLS